MTVATAPNGGETTIRAIVFKDGEKYVAQCIEYDIACQADTIADLIDRLDLTIEAEFATCEERGKRTKDCIAPAPNYYHQLWEKRAVELTRVNRPVPAVGGPHVEVALAA